MPQPRIWLVEDEASIAETLIYMLQQDGFAVTSFDRGLPVLDAATRQLPDLAILDVGLPDISGFELCRRLLARAPGLPVLFLTARSDEIDKLLGLEMGADDYIGKPFTPRVLVARVKAVMRRTGVLAADVQTVKMAGYAFNGWHLDPARCQLSDPRQQTVDLTQGEYSLLLALVQNARRVLSREQLLELTHSESIEVFDRTIDVLIMRLRRKIEINPHQPALIKTIRGLGYVFAADVVHSEQAA